MRLTGACGLLRHRHLVEILKDLADSAGQGIDLGLTVWRPVQENVPQAGVDAVLGYRPLAEFVTDIRSGIVVLGRTLAESVPCLENSVRRQQPIGSPHWSPLGC